MVGEPGRLHASRDGIAGFPGQRARLHDAIGTGGLSTPSGSQPRARVTYTAFYHDGVGREIAQASYGDNGGASFTRSDTIPASLSPARTATAPTRCAAISRATSRSGVSGPTL